MPWDPTSTVSATQVTALAASGAVQRAVWFGASLTYNGTAVVAVISGIVSKRELAEGGFELEHDALLRIKSALVVTPALGDAVVDAALSRSYRVAEIRAHKTNPEWVMGLKQL